MITGRKFRNDGVSNEEFGNGLINLGTVLGILGVLFLPFAAYSTMQYRDVQRWKVVDASIVSAGPRSPVHYSYSKSNRSGTKHIVYFVGVRYKFSFEGQTYLGNGEFGKSGSPEAPLYKEEMERFTRLKAASGTIQVVVNPRNPRESLQNRDDKIRFSSVLALWVLSFFMLLGWPTCNMLGKIVLARR